jgi:threonine synthase
MTPLLRADRLGQYLGLERLYIKDEGQNPTASFKARGLSAAVTMARALGIETIALPTAGNAGGAAAFDQFPLSIALDGTLVFTEVRLGSGNDL